VYKKDRIKENIMSRI